MPTELKAWLIEAAFARDEPYYLGTTRGNGGNQYQWVKDPAFAIRFADRPSCDWVCEAVRQAQPDLFPAVVPYPTFVEHVYINDTLVS